MSGMDESDVPDRADAGHRRLSRAGAPARPLASWRSFAYVLVAVIGYGGWLGSWYPRAVVWGDVFTGVAAIGTLAALGFAAWTVAHERGDREEALDRDRLREERSQQLARRRFAEEVTWWTEFKFDFPSHYRWKETRSSGENDQYLYELNVIPPQSVTRTDDQE